MQDVNRHDNTCFKTHYIGYMKRFILFSALIALFVAGFTSCNDDTDTTADELMTQQLPGTWRLHEDQKDESGDVTIARDVEFVFTATNFTVSYYRKTISKLVSYSINGTWDIRRETLELRYNIPSLTTSGMTKEQSDELRRGFMDNNALLDDLAGDKFQVYGMPIEVSRSGSGLGSMKLGKSADFGGMYSLFNGSYE